MAGVKASKKSKKEKKNADLKKGMNICFFISSLLTESSLSFSRGFSKNDVGIFCIFLLSILLYINVYDKIEN